MCGPWRLCARPQALAEQGISAASLAGATHLVWATGGSMVPEREMSQYLAQAEKALNL